MSAYLISLFDRCNRQASRVSLAILFRIFFFNRFIIEKSLSHNYVLPNMDTFFVQSFLSGETGLCLQASKTCRNAHSFLTKEKDSIAIHKILC